VCVCVCVCVRAWMRACDQEAEAYLRPCPALHVCRYHALVCFGRGP